MLLAESMAGDQPEVLSPLGSGPAYGHPQVGAYVPDSVGPSLPEQSGLGLALDEAAVEAEAARPHHPVGSCQAAMQHAASTPQPLAGSAGAFLPQQRPSTAKPPAAPASAAKPSTVRSSKAGPSGARQAVRPSRPTTMPSNSTEHVRKNSKAPSNSIVDQMMENERQLAGEHEEADNARYAQDIELRRAILQSRERMHAEDLVYKREQAAANEKNTMALVGALANLAPKPDP